MKLKANQLNEDPKLVNNSFYESLILNSHFSLAVVPCIILCCFASSTFDFKLKECSSNLLLHSYSVILMMVFFYVCSSSRDIVCLFFCFFVHSTESASLTKIWHQFSWRQWCVAQVAANIASSCKL